MLILCAKFTISVTLLHPLFWIYSDLGVVMWKRLEIVLIRVSGKIVGTQWKRYIGVELAWRSTQCRDSEWLGTVIVARVLQFLKSHFYCNENTLVNVCQ
jgi:hypothetical protein